MDFRAELLFPFQWLVSAIMVGLHDGLSAAGIPAANGWTYALPIVFGAGGIIFPSAS